MATNVRCLEIKFYALRKTHTAYASNTELNYLEIDNAIRAIWETAKLVSVESTIVTNTIYEKFHADNIKKWKAKIDYLEAEIAKATAQELETMKEDLRHDILYRQQKLKELLKELENNNP